MEVDTQSFVGSNVYSDEMPHAYDQESHNPYEYSEASSFDYGNHVDKRAVNTQRPNHHIMNIQDPKDPTKKGKISVFSTENHIGAPIVNAVTGIPYYKDDSLMRRHTVGSNFEYELFKTKDVSGRVNGKSMLLFYDGPSQCERHLMLKLSQTVHEKWNKGKQ